MPNTGAALVIALSRTSTTVSTMIKPFQRLAPNTSSENIADGPLGPCYRQEHNGAELGSQERKRSRDAEKKLSKLWKVAILLAT